MNIIFVQYSRTHYFIKPNKDVNLYYLSDIYILAVLLFSLKHNSFQKFQLILTQHLVSGSARLVNLK